jgi:Na+-transporting methylmalonyl-CoA/oxaloacetate decarboxylase beta subunit
MATGLIPSRQIICGGKCPFFDGTFNFTSKQDITTFIIAFARLLTYIAIPIAVIMIVVNGFLLIFGIVKDYKPFLNIAIGLAIIILAYTVTGGFAEILTNGVDINNLLK